jgi:predicted DCC family thiol-disulfide oxidoreductase YuxK
LHKYLAPEPGNALMSETGKHLILYDGVCNLCNGMVRFVLSRDRGGIFRIDPLQSTMGRGVLEELGHEPSDLDTIVVITDFESPGRNALTRSTATLFILAKLGWPWKMTSLLRMLPLRLLDLVYDMVARGRYRLFGRRDSCPMPDDPLERP